MADDISLSELLEDEVTGGASLDDTVVVDVTRDDPVVGGDEQKKSDGGIAEVLARTGEFEIVALTHEPIYNDFVRAIGYVKPFIIKHGLILYGGSAIDYALRLKGSNIYPDSALAVPDLDFYSPDNVTHAYDLADILYAEGYPEARAINAEHIETMRVDCGGKHWVADISYRPKDVFDKLPTITYENMKVIHPDFQRIDLHSSLAFPYDNPPREVVFARLAKDIKRFNILDKYYPPEPVAAKPIELKAVSFKGNFTKYVLGGFAAYAVLYTWYAREMERLGAKPAKDVLPATYKTTKDGVDISLLDNQLDLLHFDIHKACAELGTGATKFYEPYVNLTPMHARCTLRSDLAKGVQLIVHSTKNRLVSIHSIDGQRIASTQYLLKYLMSMRFIHVNELTLAATYLRAYNSVIAMVRSFEKAAVDIDPTTLVDSPLMPSVRVFGNENINIAREVQFARLYTELDRTPPLDIPLNYNPGRIIPAGKPRPEYDISQSKMFRQSGHEITI